MQNIKNQISLDTISIASNISKHITLLAEQLDHFTGLLRAESIKKNEFILKQGDACDYISYINRGTLRAFYLNENGKESTVMFAVEDWWITDMHSFLSEEPAMVHIQAIENSHILKLSKTNLDSLYEDIPEFNVFFRILMQNAYSREQLRTIQNLSLSASDRYHNFMNKYPQFANSVPLKYVASYLGVTPEFLSTIRARKN